MYKELHFILQQLCPITFKHKNTMKKLLLLITCFGFILSTQAQTSDKKWNVGLYGGAIQYQGDLGHDFYQNNKTAYGFGGISVSRFLNSYMDAQVYYTRGTLGYNSGVTGFKSDFSSISANLRIYFLKSNFILRPYASGGIGAILFDRQLNFHKELIDSALPTAGGGVIIRLNDSFAINLQETFLFTNNDSRDGFVKGADDDFLMHSVGLTYNFGKMKDADLDGVSDNKDKCPDTPAGVAVDKKGCPLDKDNDGVADYLDTCPDVAGTAALNGCPDKDAIMIPFENSSAWLVSKSYSALDNVVKILQENPLYNIRIEGHAYKTEGVNTVCNELAAERAFMVMQYFLSRNVLSKRITGFESFGNRRPINTGKNFEQILLNARAQVFLIK